MQHAFRPVREVKSFITDIATIIKLAVCCVLFCWCVAVIVDTVTANKSGMELARGYAHALPAKARAAAGLH